MVHHLRIVEEKTCFQLQELWVDVCFYVFFSAARAIFEKVTMFSYAGKNVWAWQEDLLVRDKGVVALLLPLHKKGCKEQR